jgi:hypothetical protein
MYGTITGSRRNAVFPPPSTAGTGTLPGFRFERPWEKWFYGDGWELMVASGDVLRYVLPKQVPFTRGNYGVGH